MNRALFLDRDGVININHGYVYQINGFEFIDGIFELVKRANKQGYKVFVVTNQSGIGRGMYTESDFASLTEWMVASFAAKRAFIDDVFYCPHHPEAKLEQYRKVCECRKPNAGMLRDAALKHQINLKGSVMVGDKHSDMSAAAQAGLREAFWFDPDFQQTKMLNDAQSKCQSMTKNGMHITLTSSLAHILAK